MTTALVTGATGMVGSALVRRLVDDGVDVVALVLDTDPQSELYRSGLVNSTTVVNGGLEDLPCLERAIALHEPDTVYHLGAQTIVGAAHRAPVATLEANVRGTWNVLEAARRHPDVVQAIVIASSDKAYGTTDELPYTEAHALGGTEPYEVSKAAADLIAQMYAHAYGVPLAIARCGNIFGPGDLNWSRIVPGTIRSLLRDQQPVLRSDGTFVRDYLHVDDVVTAYTSLAAALEDGSIATGEGWNFSDESPRTVMEIYEATCRAVGMPGVAPLVLDRAPGEIHDQWLSSAKARERLGWTTAVGLEDGLHTTVAWYRSFLAS
ncbi:MAG: GDP-mannose 4,6-dehydratase [Acidimicrobiia bacterium]|nr:GDP-mannose 4,6-dehydratase [Acidimicrobiia bacterium]